MRLNELKDNAGSRKFRLRIGRGIGSGMGKMGGRGGKGQTARSGVRLAGFEGGQMPLHRRLPKRGFNKLNRKVYNEINLGRLQAAIEAGMLDGKKPVDAAALAAAGIIRRPLDGVRLLGEGELKAALKLTVNHATASAKAAVEKAGGSIKLIVKKVLARRRGQAQEDRGQKGQGRQGQARGERRIGPVRRMELCTRLRGAQPSGRPVRALSRRSPIRHSGLRIGVAWPHVGAALRPRRAALRSATPGSGRNAMVSAAEQLASNLNFGAFAKAEDLKKRLWFTLGALLVYRLGTYIPIPGINPQAFADAFKDQSSGISACSTCSRWCRRAHGDLRAQHHALHLGLHHHAADDQRRADAGDAQEGRASRAASRSTSTPAT
jgi:large subunit ribosomal protein L15